MRCGEPHRVDPAKNPRAESKTSGDAECNVAPSAQVRSGNPRGQLKGVYNFAADFKRSLEIPVTLDDTGAGQPVEWAQKLLSDRETPSVTRLDGRWVTHQTVERCAPRRAAGGGEGIGLLGIGGCWRERGGWWVGERVRVLGGGKREEVVRSKSVSGEGALGGGGKGVVRGRKKRRGKGVARVEGRSGEGRGWGWGGWGGGKREANGDSGWGWGVEGGGGGGGGGPGEGGLVWGGEGGSR